MEIALADAIERPIPIERAYKDYKFGYNAVAPSGDFTVIILKRWVRYFRFNERGETFTGGGGGFIPITSQLGGQ